VVSTNLTAPAIDALLLAFHRSSVRLEDLLNTRLMLEPPIAALAAQHATPLQIRRLHDLVQDMADLAHVDPPVRAATYSYDVNARFHALVAEASQNPVLAILIEMLVGIIWRQQNTVDTQNPPERHVQTAAQHRRIVVAIESRDLDAARLAMGEHLEATRQGIVGAPGSLNSLIRTLYTS
jgi:DNA-binding FadR family transcriptional regulator